jgi:hypothetical protein
LCQHCFAETLTAGFGVDFKVLGMTGKLHGGGVGFRQYFGSALQVTPHLHMLVPEGLWTEGAVWMGVPPPDTEDVERILQRVMKGLAKDFGEVGEGWAEDGLEALWLEGVQHRLPLGEEPKRERRGRRVAVLEARREDGRYEYRTRKGQVLEFTAQGLVKRLVALIPPKGVHLTRFHGVFAPNGKLRARVVRAREKEGVAEAPLPGSGAGCVREAERPRRPRLDWASLQRRIFEADVWQCPCGGRRRVVAVISNRRTAEEVLRNLGRLPPRSPPARAQSPPQLALAV